MKLKYIVAALGLLASVAHAQIVPTTTVGGSDLLLNVWEQGAANGKPDQSFVFNLNETFTQFLNNQTSSTLATLSSTDTTWQTFLSTSDLGSLQWSVIASGSKVPTARPAILATATVGVDPTATPILNSGVISANSQLAGMISTLNVSPTPNEQISAPPSSGYYQHFSLSTFNAIAWNNGNAIGATAVMGMASNNPTGGTLPSTLALLPGTMTFAQSGSSYVLNYAVAAVPEASGLGLALAGFGVVGFLGFRRKNS